jgi:hypothetical protein
MHSKVDRGPLATLCDLLSNGPKRFMIHLRGMKLPTPQSQDVILKASYLKSATPGELRQFRHRLEVVIHDEWFHFEAHAKKCQ